MELSGKYFELYMSIIEKIKEAKEKGETSIMIDPIPDEVARFLELNGHSNRDVNKGRRVITWA